MIFLKGNINFILLFFSAMFLFTSCQNDVQQFDKNAKKKLGIEEATNVNINYTLTGKTKGILKAPIMWRVQDTVSYVEFPKNIHVDFYNDSSKLESLLDAHYGKYIESQSKILMRDSVRFIGLKNGDTLYCNELYWDRNRPTYQFYTDAPVQIRTKTQIIDGVGFETSQDFKDKVIRQVTNSYIKVPAAQFPEN